MGMASTRGATIKRRRPGVAMEMARQTSEKAQLRDGNGGSHSCSRAAPGLDRGRLGAASDRAQGGRFTCCSLARCRTARECAPLKDWRDAFVLDEQHRAGATRWAKGRNGGGGDLGGLDLRVAKPRDIIPHRERAQADLVVGVRFAEMAPVVPRDVPS